MSAHLTEHSQPGGRTFEVAADGPLALEFVGAAADLDVTLDGPEGHADLEVTASEGVDLDAIEVALTGNRLRVRIPALIDDGPGASFGVTIGRFSWQRGRRPRIDVTVRLPAGSDLDVDAGSGDVTVAGTPGRLAVRTGSGDISLSEAVAARVGTGSGDLRVDRADGGELSTGSGDLTVRSGRGSLHLRSGSGDVIVEELDGDLTAGSGSGDIFCRDVAVGSVTARCGSGDVSVRVRPGVAVWQELSSGSGDVSRTLTPRGEPGADQPYVTVKASTASGDIALMDV